MTSADTENRGSLDGDALQKLLSPYLENGFQQDEYRVNEVTFEGPVATARCSLPTYYVSGNENQFHLSGLGGTAFVWQVGIAHAHFLAGVAEKRDEVLLRDYSLKCSNVISDPEHVEVELRLRRKRALGSSKSIYSWSFNIDGGVWKGDVTAIFAF